MPPIADTRIAELLLRRMAKEMNPGECRELMSWANQNAANRQQMEDLTSPGKLIGKLRNFYNTRPVDAGPNGLLHACDDPINSASADTGFLPAGL